MTDDDLVVAGRKIGDILVNGGPFPAFDLLMETATEHAEDAVYLSLPEDDVRKRLADFRAMLDSAIEYLVKVRGDAK